MIILFAIFVISFIFNKLIVKKLSKDDMGFFFVIVMLLMFVEIEKKNEKKSEGIPIKKIDTIRFFLVILIYILLQIIYIIFNLAMNISLYLFGTLSMFLLTRAISLLFIENEGIATYIALTSTLLFSLYGAKFYSLVYRIFDKKNDVSEQAYKDDFDSVVKEYSKQIQSKYNFIDSYNEIFTVKNLKVLTFLITIILVFITSIEKVGKIDIFEFEWWRSLTDSAYYSVVTFIAIDRLERFIYKPKNEKTKNKLPENSIPEPINNDEENENGN